MPADVIVVVKRTAYKLYVDDEHDERAARLLARDDPAVAMMRFSHEEHEGTVEEVRDALETLGARVTWVRRAHAQFDASRADLVVTVGGDGTLLGASHNVGSTPILGVNSAPSHSVGFFCGATKGHVLQSLEDALSGRLKPTLLARMSVLLNGKAISHRVLNDALFCHASPAATSRYIVQYRGATEEQKSSGFWVGPAAGSTAAQRSAGGKILPLTSLKLQYVVREPYTPAGNRLEFGRLLIDDGHEVVIRSKMREARLFLDGPHESRNIELGDELVFRRSPELISVLNLKRHRGWASRPRMPARRNGGAGKARPQARSAG